jgi:NTE family protein
LWASGLAANAIKAELFALRRPHFWDPAPGLGLLRGRLFRERLESLLVARTFAACRAPLAVSVYDLLSRSTRVVTDGELAPALQASCTVPLLFQPVWSGSRPMLDGGIADRPGILGLAPGERTLHHHLASRSPWRRKDGDSMQIPARPGLLALVLGDLPRVGPFRLERGPHAYEVARLAARRALDLRVTGDVLHVG